MLMDALQAHVCYVEPESPAALAGIRPGDVIISADGNPLRDIIDWRWFASDYSVEIEYLDSVGVKRNVVLERDIGQEWGIEFEDFIFDAPLECKNRCTFCFMRQLPEDSRSSLRLRDDDYRMSFLQGNFVTFTNLEEVDVERILQQHISPLRFSLHAVDPDLRKEIIGPLASKGIEIAQRLLDGGIQLHAQIVLMPHVNDGAYLEETLTWAYNNSGIVDVAIVPLGFTSHQDVFTESFQSVDAASAVLNTVKPFQVRALQERGIGWAYPSDEFYRNAYPDSLLENLPDASFYGDFNLFEDGIGIVRSFIDDWNESRKAQEDLACALKAASKTILMVCGCAQKEFLSPLLEGSPLHDSFMPLYVKNDYFGGNVDVTGLLCGCDIVRAVPEAVSKLEAASVLVVVPEIIFNADNVTLDDMTVEQMSEKAGVPLHVVSCEASKFLPQIQALVEAGGATCQNT